MKDIMEIGHEVQDFIRMLVNHIFDASGDIMKQSIAYEDNINRLRKHIRKGHIKRLNAQTCSVQQGLIFIDMLTSFEKMGDHAFNVAEVFAGER
jgi:phosphate:Na+ symporter